MRELQQALAVRVGQGEASASFDHRKLTSPDLIVRAGGGLIAYDRNSHLVTFSHEIVRPFLLDNELLNLPSECDLCKVCIYFLDLTTHDSMYDGWSDYSDVGIIPPYKHKYKFTDYAAKFWAAHAVSVAQKQRDTQLEALIISIFSNPRTREVTKNIRTGSHLKDWEPLLHFLIDCKLDFLFRSPSPSEWLDCNTCYPLPVP